MSAFPFGDSCALVAHAACGQQPYGPAVKQLPSTFLHEFSLCCNPREECEISGRASMLAGRGPNACASLLLRDCLRWGTVSGSNCPEKMLKIKRQTWLLSWLPFSGWLSSEKELWDSCNLIDSFPETSNTGNGCKWETPACLLPLPPVPVSVGKQFCGGCYRWWPWKQNN